LVDHHHITSLAHLVDPLGAYRQELTRRADGEYFEHMRRLGAGSSSLVRAEHHWAAATAL
jgi:hypothetical protein